MIEIKKIFLIFYIALTGCSESEDLNRIDAAPYLPFSPEAPVKLSAHELEKLSKFKDFVMIHPGEFSMGSPKNENGRSDDETQHRVRITKPFWISKFEVTNLEWNKNLPHFLMRGNLVFNLKTNILKKLCLTGNFDDGNYTIREYENQEDDSKAKATKRFFFEESFPNSGTTGNWEIGGNERRSYPIDNERFSGLNKILGFLDQKKIRPIGRIGQKNPVTRVSYSQATAFCWKSSTYAHSEGNLPKGMFFRLPTEAEWEYVCRAGTEGFCGLGSGERLSGVNACINGSRPEFVLGGQAMLINRKKVAPINPDNPKYPSNAWGIHDMHGNVMEWCHDFYGTYTTSTILVNPLGPFNGSRRVLRGGSFYRPAFQCRSASRASYEPSYRGSEIGFRMVIGFPVL